MMVECVFCKIVKGELPCHKVFESDDILAFLNINPVNEGHTLIIPKIHYENIFDISNRDIKNIISVAKMLALNYRVSLNARAVNILNASWKEAQQSVFHFHMHVVPRYDNDGLYLWFNENSVEKNILDNTLKKIEESLR